MQPGAMDGVLIQGEEAQQGAALGQHCPHQSGEGGAAGPVAWSGKESKGEGSSMDMKTGRAQKAHRDSHT